MKAIYLTGFMGSGKTTVAEELSKALALPSEDTDKHITKMQGREIPVIFESEGEKAFRSYETASLKNLPTENIIISTGGGIVLSEKNRSYMKQNGTMIYLHCEPEEIVKRLEGDTSRPLLAGDNKQNKINTIFTERLPLYREADYEIETTNRSVQDIVAEICQRIG
ncbi:shikimate kinase [Pseudalkalibacillus hwajinpoensis]|uniref:shikimate kinase n=1 Tax=Guptibacillus hwajinpoensis TaxID=208199 RepID=UPI001CD7EA33|nr:shikimate kinase [Pseudalkalibacillus hwajinpoensis]MCA0991022.1 shikimate kinase [Pseudalkalibacillus hwajinpoensis]